MFAHKILTNMMTMVVMGWWQKKNIWTNMKEKTYQDQYEEKKYQDQYEEEKVLGTI